MTYKVEVPISGFETKDEFLLNKIDDFFSILKSSDDEIELRIMSFNILKNLEFDLPDDFIAKMEIKDISDISIYFIFVVQNPITNSIVNMYAPLIFNNKNMKMGQAQIDINSLGFESLDKLLSF